MLDPLYPYQETGALYLAEHPEALLADEMGLGKSAQAIRACDHVGANNILIFCPAAVRINWSREFTRFSPFDRPAVVIESNKDVVPLTGVVVSSYDMAVTLAHKFAKGTWDVVILDEAHYCKERKAKRTKAIYGTRKRPLHTKRMWRLTGTPAPNDVSELWTHLYSAGLVDVGYWPFVETYCTGFDAGYGFKITGTKNATQLKQLLARFMLRRLKKDVMTELPPITVSNFTIARSPVDLDPFFFEKIQEVGINTFLAEMKEADATLRQSIDYITRVSPSTMPAVLSVLDGFKTSQATLRRYIGLAKTPVFCDLMEEELKANPHMKLVIFAVHKDVIEMCRHRLRKFKAVTLYGNTPAAKRQSHIDRFQNEPACRVFIGNIVAAGVGITLTASHEVAFIESSWTPAENAQAAMRCHRIGQEEPVRVRFFSCAGSVDEQINETVARKTRELLKIF